MRCDFIEERVDRQKIAIASWEGDASNVMLPISYKTYNVVSSIIDGGSCINSIAKKLYDAWELPKMEPAPFSIKLVDQRRVTPLGLVKKCACKSSWNKVFNCICSYGPTLTQLIFLNLIGKTLVESRSSYA